PSALPGDRAGGACWTRARRRSARGGDGSGTAVPALREPFTPAGPDGQPDEPAVYGVPSLLVRGAGLPRRSQPLRLFRLRRSDALPPAVKTRSGKPRQEVLASRPPTGRTNRNLSGTPRSAAPPVVVAVSFRGTEPNGSGAAVRGHGARRSPAGTLAGA